ncbi:MAG: helix-turn-helix transcriptional regulator [Paludibacteraceae bacterium]|nr:helix-turn-helix transcriptional regulator [Paludibacteraceae bacterium]
MGKSLFDECVECIPAGLKSKLDLSFAVADRIAMILETKGMSQRELARRMNKRPSEISKWLRGTHNFTLSTIADVSNVLGEPIIEVVNGRACVIGSCIAAESPAEYKTSNPHRTR